MEASMLKAFTKYGGIIQAILGVVGTAAPDTISTLGTGAGANVFNLLSGATLSYLGFKGTESQQRTGALGIGGLNALVGLLGVFGVSTISGIPLNEGTVGIIINLAIGAWGLISGFMKKSA
jgi:hypothetical protein